MSYFRTAKAARILNLTDEDIHRLVEAGLITTTLSPGGQLRIAAEEVARLQRDGIPEIPLPDRPTERAPVFSKPNAGGGIGLGSC